MEYKQTGWKLDPDGRHITFTDGCGIGRVRLIGSRDLATRPIPAITRIRLIRRVDGYYAQFCIQAQRRVEHVPTGKQVGIDVGLKAFSTDSEGNTVENPCHYRKAEKRLKRLQRRLSHKQKKSKNRKKARQAVAYAHLKVQRQREDFARKQANALVTSHDLIAFEELQIRNMVRNRHLAKSIHDAGWGQFLLWVKYYAAMHTIPVIVVSPHYTSQECSTCGTLVKKTLSVRTHVCTACGVVLDRDHNAALNILQKALSTVGHTGCAASALVESLLSSRG
ncbi:hypothetical protein KSB_62310 [Ktedonobacter robiniae]|uniref:Transposase n=1 Tax=Ktedonobacter robiniae TaxID=2778365 RepID=A0ABQ3UY07_9CHLR|nr:hypothetical protein KSB_62310 [Ktedonobacter robiniae]